MMRPIEKPTIKQARGITDEHSIFLPMWRQHQVSPYVAYWNKRGMNLRTRMVVVRGVWGTAIEKRKD